MRIEVEFVGFPTIYDIFQEVSHPHSFSGETLSDLIESLIEKYGERLIESLLDPGTHAFDPAIQIMVNRQYVGRESLHLKKMKEGDKVTFLRLLAGG